MLRRVFVCLLVLGLCGHVSASLVGYWALDGNAIGGRTMLRRVFVCLLVLGLCGHVSASLVGYWALDGNATDSSDYGNHGTINGNVVPAVDRFGDPNGAMSFAGGGGDNINVGDPPEFNMTGAMTSTSPVAGARNGRIVGKMGGGGRRAWSTGIEKNVSGVAVPATVQVASDGNTVVSLSDNNPLPQDQWVHYAGVYTPGTSLEVYLNGELSHSRTSGIPASQHSDNGQPVLIGHRPACGDCGWYGSLDEIRIYDEALTGAQIKAIMELQGVPAQREAHSPQPAHRATGVPIVGTALSWKPGVDLANPTTPNPGITGYYLWLSPAYDPADAPSVSEWWNDPLVQVVFIDADTNPADGQVDETASYALGTLQTDALYYWAVDESLGAANKDDLDHLILGNTRSFETVTSSPIVSAGDDIMTWLSEGVATVDLNGAVTDATDDLTAILWSVVASPPDSTVDFADPSLAATTVALSAAGQYVLQLHAVDAMQNEASDEVEITVYNDSCEAAKSLPDYVPIPGDLNGDCRVDDLDMAILEEHWLECNALDCNDVM